MSWYLSTPVTSGEQFEATIGALELDTADGKIEYTPDAFEQLAAAKTAVLAIFRSGAVGSPERSYIAHMSGHTNPNHLPAKGWSNDTINISVYQADPPTPLVDEAPTSREAIP